MSALSDLQAQVTATIAVEQAAVTAIQTLTADIASLEAVVAEGNTAQIEALVSQLAVSANTLQASVTAAVPPANTVTANT